MFLQNNQISKIVSLYITSKEECTCHLRESEGKCYILKQGHNHNLFIAPLQLPLVNANNILQKTIFVMIAENKTDTYTTNVCTYELALSMAFSMTG